MRKKLIIFKVICFLREKIILLSFYRQQSASKRFISLSKKAISGLIFLRFCSFLKTNKLFYSKSKKV
jgi:hypothetical protein